MDFILALPDQNKILKMTIPRKMFRPKSALKLKLLMASLTYPAFTVLTLIATI
jgi:hypothetical protein